MTSARNTSHPPTVGHERRTKAAAEHAAQPSRAAPSAATVSNGTELLVVIRKDGSIGRFVPSSAHTFGYTEDELRDQAFTSVIHPGDRASTGVALDKLARGYPIVGLENRFRCKDGSFRRLVWTAMPTPEGLVYAVAQGITQRRPTEQQRARSQARGQATAVARQNGVVAVVCHDIQQPLTVILAQIQLLQRNLIRGESVSAERLDVGLAYMFAAATRVRDMTQDLLDASMDHAGRPVSLLLARTDLVSLARAAVAAYAPLSDVHQFVVEAEPPALEADVDPTRMHRVLASLLTNAMKYSPDGGLVRVTLKKAHDERDGGSALIVVRDEGVGIPRADLAHIFDRFHRGANVVNRFSGTGLGLASARELVNLHGGDITVDSEEGKGSTFVVRLPLPGLSETSS